jgi:NAD(P)H-dependent flavin oxidoreductase YrpB (nitropropane dioxygenase family)
MARPRLFIGARGPLLPPAQLFDRVKRAGAKVLASATTVTEARWLADRGVDAVIAMGFEAGGHRGCDPASLVLSPKAPNTRPTILER